MVPRIASRGTSFKGAALYYLHDKEAMTAERVDFTHTENLPSTDPEKAWRWMAYTAMNADELKRVNGATTRRGRRCEKPVFSLSLSWHPEQQPDREHMIETGRSALEALGLQDYQVMMVAHRDESYKHLHLMVNIVHPETGRAHTTRFSKLSLSKWAEAYEREHGKIYCEQRTRNNEQRRLNELQRDEERKRTNLPRLKGVRVYYQDPEINQKELITRLYREAKDARAFKESVEKAGFKLAQGKKLLLIDSQGKTHSLTRQIEGAKERDIRQRLRDLKLQKFEEMNAEQEKAKQETGRRKREEEERERENQNKKKTRTREAEGVQPQFAARNAQQSANRETLAERQAPRPARYSGPPAPTQINRLQDRQREEVIQHRDETRRISERWIGQADHKYGAQEELLRKEVAAHERQLKEFEAKRIKIGQRSRMNAVQERLTEMRYKLAVIEDYKADHREHYEKKAQEHARGLQALQQRHEQERKTLWDNPKAQLQQGREFNARSNPEKPAVETERPLVELPATLQEKIQTRAVQKNPGVVLKDRKPDVKTPERNDPAAANDNARSERREFNREAGKPEVFQQKEKGANDNRRPEAQKFNRSARGRGEEMKMLEHFIEEEKIEALLDKQDTLQDRGIVPEPEASRDFEQAIQTPPSVAEQQKADPDRAAREALLDQWNGRQGLQQERAPEFDQATPAQRDQGGKQRADNPARDPDREARERLLDQWSGHQNRQQERSRAEEKNMDTERERKPGGREGSEQHQRTSAPGQLQQQENRTQNPSDRDPDRAAREALLDQWDGAHAPGAERIQSEAVAEPAGPETQAFNQAAQEQPASNEQQKSETVHDADRIAREALLDGWSTEGAREVEHGLERDVSPDIG